MINEQSIEDFLEQLASSAPTPGGGSAAAIMGAMAAALAGMVCNLTVGKEQYAAVEAELQVVLQRAAGLRRQMTALISADVAVFDQVMGAYAMPREADADKAARSAAIQTALRAATEVPLACARACAEIMAITATVAEKGNVNVISDAGVAVMAAYAAMKSAALNVYINAGSIKDAAFARHSVAEIEALTAAAETRSRQIFALVRSRL